MNAVGALLLPVMQRNSSKLWSPRSGARFGELLSHVNDNIATLDRLGLNASHALAVDVTTGERCVPVLLALLLQGITVVPVQNTDIEPELAERVTGIVEGGNTDPSGRLTDVTKLKLQRRDKTLCDVALIMHTSGTSGRSKAVMLTYGNIAYNCAAIASVVPFNGNETILLARSLVHASAIVGELLLALLLGQSVVFASGPFSVAALGACIRNYKAQVIFATPTVMNALASSQSVTTLTTLRHVVISGEPLSAQRLERISSALPAVRLIYAYGLTEAAPRVSMLTDTADRPADCVGRPLPGTEVRVDDGGQLLVRGPGVMKGYWRNVAATQTALGSGWLQTGDKAEIDEEGNVYIKGRLDHMLIRGGVNIRPSDVEEALLTMPAIREVYVFGVPHDVYGQQIHAWIEPQRAGLKLSDVIGHLAGSGTDRRLWPDVMTIKPHIPRTASGKACRGRDLPAQSISRQDD